MRLLLQLISIVVVTVCLYSSCCGSEFDDDLEGGEDKWPSVGISIVVQNKAHTLPYALTCLEHLDYPKNRLHVWFYIDLDADDSAAIINAWSKRYNSEYNEIYVTTEKVIGKFKKDSVHWNEERLRRMVDLREKGLAFARKRWADYALMLDADVFLSDPQTLKVLVRKRLPVVVPMLVSNGYYSNFWRSEDYQKIVNQDMKGCFEVALVHSAVLIDLRTKKSDLLSYDPGQGVVDDVNAFAVSASDNDIPMWVCNDRLYGFMPVPLDQVDGDTTETELLLNLKMEALGRRVELPLDPELASLVVYPPRDRLGLDQIYIINLERRTEKRRFMELSFRELGIEAIFIKGVDGAKLDINDLSKHGVTLMKNYEDPYHKRPMKLGEIGCFLSHYSVWKEIAKRQVKRALVLEDDVRFLPYFRRKFEELLKDLDMLDWEFVYIGRKLISEDEEDIVTPRLSRPRYSYWTLGYLISEAGARRLIQAEPLAKMLPVDEFLPIMFDQHPNKTWNAFFPRRALKAFAANPVLILPTHFVGEEGYVSDTEESNEVTGPAELFTHDGSKSVEPL